MMGILKFKKSRNAESADSSRRSFVWKMGAGASAALASTVGMAKAETGAANSPSLQVALLQEERALRKVHQAFEFRVGLLGDGRRKAIEGRGHDRLAGVRGPHGWR